MGGEAPTNANTTNNYQANTSVGGSIGFTGDQAANILNVLTRNVGNTLNQLGFRVEGTLGNTVNTSAELALRTNLAGYELTNGVVNRSATLFERTALNSTSTLNGVVNAVQDFSQRAIAAGTGQRTEIQQIGPAASQYEGTAPGSENKWVIIGTVVAVVALLMNNGKG